MNDGDAGRGRGSAAEMTLGEEGIDFQKALEEGDDWNSESTEVAWIRARRQGQPTGEGKNMAGRFLRILSCRPKGD